jgi:CheY-like chemotaxis protein
MRLLREDPVARESAVLVLSAQEAHVEILKAARAGARAWLKKTGRAKELLDAVELLARPRAQVWGHLSALQPATIELRAIGPVWLLRTLAELDCRGRLLVEDELSRFEVRVSQGLLGAATAQVGSRRLHGLSAIQALLGSRGRGVFEPRETSLPPGAPWLHEVVQSACEALSTESQLALERAMSRPEALYLNQELALLFARVATAREIQVMDAFALSPRPVEALAQEVHQSDEEVRAALVELLRRGVLSVEPV